jgi:hypothetical protein
MADVEETVMPIEPVGELLAFDPGAIHPAAALFRGGSLVRAERIRFSTDVAELAPTARAVAIASAAIRWVMGHEAEPRVLVCEHPQVYRAGKGRGDPNDLLLLASINGALAGALSLAVAQRDVGLVVLSPTPAEWIGQLPKVTVGDAWGSPRGALVKRCLSGAEFLVVESNHDSIDAAGLGLWALGRLVRTRVFSGASQ